MSRKARPRGPGTAPFRGEGLDKLKAMADVELDPWIDHTPLRIYKAQQLADRAAKEGANIVIVESDRCAGPLFELPLLALGSARGDPNNVDIPPATKAAIPVLRAPGRNADAVAEMSVALLFAVNRHLIQADEDVRTGATFKDGPIPYQRFRTWQLAGQTAGLVGLGAVGRATQWRLEGLGMKVIAFDPYSADAKHSLEELLAQSDVISMHAVVTPETEGMIGAKQFEQMRKGAVYINTARAMLHDTDALVQALNSGQVAGAGLDHFVGEHLAPEHPLVQLANVVLTPHIGGATYDTEANQSNMLADDIERLLRGERPVNI